MPGQSNISFIVLALREWLFAIFTEKNSHNSGENERNSKKFKLVLKTVHKKILLKSENTSPIKGFLHCVRPLGMVF